MYLFLFRVAWQLPEVHVRDADENGGDEESEGERGARRMLCRRERQRLLCDTLLASGRPRRGVLSDTSQENF